MIYRARLPGEIAAARRAAIVAGAALVAKGRCHCCDWTVPAKALWCSESCASDYAAEAAMVAGNG